MSWAYIPTAQDRRDARFMRAYFRAHPERRDMPLDYYHLKAWEEEQKRE